jgi:hypothetical protein
MEKEKQVCRHSLSESVSVETHFDPNGPYLLRFCGACGIVLGWNRAQQKWDTIGSLTGFTWVLGTCEMLAKKNKVGNEKNISTLANAQPIGKNQIVDICVAPSGPTQFQ